MIPWETLPCCESLVITPSSLLSFFCLGGFWESFHYPGVRLTILSCPDFLSCRCDGPDPHYHFFLLVRLTLPSPSLGVLW